MSFYYADDLSESHLARHLLRQTFADITLKDLIENFRKYKEENAEELKLAAKTPYYVPQWKQFAHYLHADTISSGNAINSESLVSLIKAYGINIQTNCNGSWAANYTKEDLDLSLIHI